MVSEFLSQATVPQFITLPDVIVFILLIAATCVSIVYGHSKKHQPTTAQGHVVEHLLMGRTLTLPMFVATLVASWYGGIFGVTEIAFNSGIYNFLIQGIFWYITYIIFALFMVEKIAKYRSVTLPELVGQMFGPRAGKVAAVFNFFDVLPITYALSLGIFLQTLTGLSLAASIIIGTGLVSVYSILGGMRADVYSDLIQFAVMCAAVFLVMVFSFAKIGGIDYLQDHLPSTHLEILGGHTIAATLVWGLIALSTLVDPLFYQKCFAVENPKQA